MIYVEREAGNSIDWYWRNKRSKSFFSRIIRFLAITLTAAAGIFPIAVEMLNPLMGYFQLKYQIPHSGLASSLFVGLAAGLYGFDKAFGLSSGWTRYVLTATLLEKTLEQFRLQWTLLMAKTSREPTPDQIEALLACARDFRVGVAQTVLQETKDWVTEFQDNLGQLERETQAQIEDLRARVETSRKNLSDESLPGAVELTVSDATRSDDNSFDVSIDTEKGLLLKETARSTITWATTGIAPGSYRLLLKAKFGGKEIAVAKVLIIKPGETTSLQIQFQP